MQRSGLWDASLCVGILCLFSLTAVGARAQQAPPGSSPGTEQGLTVAVPRELLERLQTQVQGLAAELKEVRADQAGERSEIAELRRQLTESNTKLAALTNSATPDAVAPNESRSTSPPISAQGGRANPEYGSDVVAGLHEDLQ